MKALKFPSFEDRWLNNAKNDIKILNSDKQFISLVKNKKEKEIKTEIEEEKKVNNEKDKNYKKELNIINIENKKDEGTIISPRKKVNLFIDFNTQKLNKLNNSSDSILPSLSSRKHSGNNNKIIPNIKNNIKNNFSYFGTIENNIFKTNLKSINNSKSLFSISRNNR